ncbi:MAG: erythromycin esterase family protein [Saprospiraceae bacterium]
MRVFKLLILFIFFILCKTNAQYNLSFEENIKLRNFVSPGNWVLLGDNIRNKKDSVSPSDGIFNLCIEPLNFSESDNIKIYNSQIIINNDIEVNEDIKFYIDIRGEILKVDSLLLRIKSFDLKFTLLEETVKTYNANISEFWTKYEITQKIKSDRISKIFFEFEFYGKGSKIEFDNVEFYIDDTSFKNSYVKNDIHFMNKMKEYIYPINNYDISSISNKKLLNVLAKSKILSLGENSHGCHEIQKMRSNICKFLIENENFKSIILEENYFKSFFLNEALKDTASESLLIERINGLPYWINKNSEFYELIKYLRLNGSVSLFGCDIRIFNAMYQILNLNNDELTDNTLQTNELKKYVSNLMSNSSSINIDEAKLKMKSFLPIKKLQELDNALIENVYLQSLIRVKSNNMISRDSSMAENVKLIQKYQDKILLLAHNGHISKSNYCTGNFLNTYFKEKFVNIGFTFYSGNYLAKDSESVEVFSLPELPANSFESLFSKFGYDVFLIDLKSLRENIDLYKEFSPRVLLELGASSLRNSLDFRISDLGHDFDYIIFIKEITPSKGI